MPFNGNEIKNSIFGIPSILVFLDKTFEMTHQLKLIPNDLWVWHNIVPYFNIVKYENEDHYKESILNLNLILRFFMQQERKLFFTKKDTGDLENPYSRVLRFYLPQHEKTTWDRHQLGL